MGYGVTTTDEVALAWFLSFLIAEIFTAVLLMPLRILVISVVLPSLVRQDVSIERAMFNLPHWSAAALFARLRTDLVPGLSLILDERFIKLIDRIAEERQGQGKRVSLVDSETGHALPRMLQVSRKRLRKRQRKLKKEELTSAISLDELVTVLKADDQSSLDLSKMNLVSSSRSGAFLSYAGGVSVAASQMSAMGSASKLGDAMGLAKLSARKIRVFAEDEDEGDPNKSFDMKLLEENREPGSPDHFNSVVALRIARGHENEVQRTGIQAKSNPKGDGKEEKKGQKDENGKSRRLKASESFNGMTAQELANELQRRSLPMKWATRALLAAFAVVVLLPEPFQDLLLEEGLPIGFAFFVLADTGLPIQIQIVEIFVNAVLLLTFVLLLLSLIFIVQRSIVRKIEVLKKQGENSET
eukprot:scaffold458_cov206-Pinguiococcus_pyrenoidosus.AAC.3